MKNQYVVKSKGSNLWVKKSRRNSNFKWVKDINEATVWPSTGPIKLAFGNRERSIDGFGNKCILPDWVEIVTVEIKAVEN